jgi:hypothetical protein
MSNESKVLVNGTPMEAVFPEGTEVVADDKVRYTIVHGRWVPEGAVQKALSCIHLDASANRMELMNAMLDGKTKVTGKPYPFPPFPLDGTEETNRTELSPEEKASLFIANECGAVSEATHAILVEHIVNERKAPVTELPEPALSTIQKYANFRDIGALEIGGGGSQKHYQTPSKTRVELEQELSSFMFLMATGKEMPEDPLDKALIMANTFLPTSPKLNAIISRAEELHPGLKARLFMSVEGKPDFAIGDVDPELLPALSQALKEYSAPPAPESLFAHEPILASNRKTPAEMAQDGYCFGTETSTLVPSDDEPVIVVAAGHLAEVEQQRGVHREGRGFVTRRVIMAESSTPFTGRNVITSPPPIVEDLSLLITAWKVMGLDPDNLHRESWHLDIGSNRAHKLFVQELEKCLDSAGKLFIGPDELAEWYDMLKLPIRGILQQRRPTIYYPEDQTLKHAWDKMGLDFARLPERDRNLNIADYSAWMLFVAEIRKLFLDENGVDWLKPIDNELLSKILAHPIEDILDIMPRESLDEMLAENKSYNA